ncbi:hypothetical protein MCOR27_000663 [Pyricularia oryzae]|uniref:Uncharacterized protein n=4 Tax=Pyricularia oryzae TaxID=318829 RepID=G4NHA7_PYRO7|nr:uncharacterized protein MGG_12091 [Pyricularia oryzae 70-15]XP_029750412.1 hypothetical protein PpBr36_04359 [Pyricularia pennisetigena]ELQ39717.1 hypothetical protein OOU_Y34scaffold00487g62 [Pyricularia oryzae Y34]KAH8846114.1 hypothetical protein MCOR01_003323 [Pyricularia oryzae]EHA47617.1 hypothetical protein MGG_12091 [Pyricularia oryzae 70-15]KAH9432377.1 hypothetical protein MCOR02_007078 [Pyricularia oryzae]KAI6260135.1 hypothetical protein MCOR19_003551 [Pyricularia oryzae]
MTSGPPPGQFWQYNCKNYFDNHDPCYNYNYVENRYCQECTVAGRKINETEKRKQKQSPRK